MIPSIDCGMGRRPFSDIVNGLGSLRASASDIAEVGEDGCRAQEDCLMINKTYIVENSTDAVINPPASELVYYDFLAV